MSVKKEASGRRSVQVEVEVPGSTQSAAARRSAEAELRTLIAKFAPAHLRLIGAMRRSLRKRLPTAHEVVYEYHNRADIAERLTQGGAPVSVHIVDQLLELEGYGRRQAQKTCSMGEHPDRDAQFRRIAELQTRVSRFAEPAAEHRHEKDANFWATLTATASSSPRRCLGPST